MSDGGTAWLWSAGLLGLAVGLGLGFVLAYFVLLRDKRASQLQEELDRHRAQFETFRTQVDQHFVKTSELFQDMTERYRSIYEHLAQGAQSLCSDRLVTHRLTVPQSGPMVEHRSDADRQALEGERERHTAPDRNTEPPPYASAARDDEPAPSGTSTGSVEEPAAAPQGAEAPPHAAATGATEAPQPETARPPKD